MIDRHPGTVCWAARLCTRSQISNFDEASDLYELDGGVSSSGDFADFDSPQIIRNFATELNAYWFGRANVDQRRNGSPKRRER